MSIFALNRFTKKQNKKWGFKLDKTVAEEEEEIEVGEKAAKEKDEHALQGVFDSLAGDDDIISDDELTKFLTNVASDPESGLPQEFVMPVVEFVGFFVPEYAQCTMDWDMNFDDFVQMVEMFESGTPHPDMDEAITFSFIDADNKCTIDEQEAVEALKQMGVPEDDMGKIMDVLGQFAGEDGIMTFDEFKGADAVLSKGPENKKLKMHKRRFSMKKKHMARKLMKLLRKAA